MILSILTPAVPARLRNGSLAAIQIEIERQIGQLAVEHLILCDNKRRTVGEKRDALLRSAHGDYVAYVDDDDWISPDYIADILAGAKSNPDVITFEQGVEFNGLKGTVQFRLGNVNEQFRPGEITKRNAWHVCAWRRVLAVCSHFPANNYGEDWAFAAPLCNLNGLREVHIPKILHHYRHDDRTTEAPPPI